MGFKDYKIRDGVHLPTDAYRKNYDSIFKKKKCKTHTKEKENNNECCHSEEQTYLED